MCAVFCGIVKLKVATWDLPCGTVVCFDWKNKRIWLTTRPNLNSVAYEMKWIPMSCDELLINWERGHRRHLRRQRDSDNCTIMLYLALCICHKLRSISYVFTVIYSPTSMNVSTYRMTKIFFPIRYYCLRERTARKTVGSHRSVELLAAYGLSRASIS